MGQNNFYTSASSRQARTDPRAGHFEPVEKLGSMSGERKISNHFKKKLL